MGNAWAIISSMGCQLPDGWSWFRGKKTILDNSKVENYSSLTYDQSVWDAEICQHEFTLAGGYQGKNAVASYGVSYSNETSTSATDVPSLHDAMNGTDYKPIEDDDDDLILYQSGSPNDSSLPKAAPVHFDPEQTVAS